MVFATKIYCLMEMRDIPNYEGLYQIDVSGNIFRLVRGGLKFMKIKPTMTSTGYPAIPLRKNGKMKIVRIHRILATLFVPNPSNKQDVNHINGIKTDNRIENLEWVTRSENIKHSYDVLKRCKVDGALNGKSKLLIDMQTGIFYDSIKFAAIAKNVPRDKMKSALYSKGCFDSILYA